jgi:hypothetical protein
VISERVACIDFTLSATFQATRENIFFPSNLRRQSGSGRQTRSRYAVVVLSQNVVLLVALG